MRGGIAPTWPSGPGRPHRLRADALRRRGPTARGEGFGWPVVQGEARVGASQCGRWQARFNRSGQHQRAVPAMAGSARIRARATGRGRALEQSSSTGPLAGCAREGGPSVRDSEARVLLAHHHGQSVGGSRHRAAPRSSALQVGMGGHPHRRCTAALRRRRPPRWASRLWAHRGLGGVRPWTRSPVPPLDRMRRSTVPLRQVRASAVSPPMALIQTGRV